MWTVDLSPGRILLVLFWLTRLIYLTISHQISSTFDFFDSIKTFIFTICRVFVNLHEANHQLDI